MGGGATPEPVRQDPEADAERIAAEAAVAANAQAARRKRSQRQSSLVLSEPRMSGVLSPATGKTTLGG